MVNTKFTVEKRDLFTVPKDYYLCHCISADFALGDEEYKIYLETLEAVIDTIYYAKTKMKGMSENADT